MATKREEKEAQRAGDEWFQRLFECLQRVRQDQQAEEAARQEAGTEHPCSVTTEMENSVSANV